MSAIARYEDAFVSAWPSLETVTDQGWCARFSKGLSRRANCIQCNDPADDADPAARLDRLGALYDDHRLPAVFRVTPLTGRDTLDALAPWRPTGHALILTMPIASTLGIDGDCAVTDPADPAFLAAQIRLQNYDASSAAIFSAILANLTAPAIGLTLHDAQGEPLASLLAVETGGIGVFLNVVTAPDARRKGFGRRLMTSGLSWLGENGANAAALQVAAQNGPGIGLYLSAGFRYRYPYHYRLRPEEKHP